MTSIDIGILIVLGSAFLVLFYYKHKNNVEKSDRYNNVKREQEDKAEFTRDIIKIKSNYKK